MEKVAKSGRHKFLAKYEPDFVAVGEESFNGYVVYGYTERNLILNRNFRWSKRLHRENTILSRKFKLVGTVTQKKI